MLHVCVLPNRHQHTQSHRLRVTCEYHVTGWLVELGSSLGLRIKVGVFLQCVIYLCNLQ
jgi:hypothetical protein